MEVIATYAWAGALLFSRIGAVLMLAPGWGEAAISMRFRLVAALLATAAIAPGLANSLPPTPPTMGLSLVMVIGEVLIGLMIGAVGRLMMSALQIAGNIIGLKIGLAMAQQMDPTMGQTGAVIGAFLSMTAVVIIFATGVHHLVLRATVESYTIFSPGQYYNVGDASQWAIATMSASFRIGLQISAPFVLFALVFNLAIGLVSRLIPQVQIYFIAMPSQVMIGLAMMAFVIGGGMMVWLEAMERVASLQSPF